MTFSIGDEMPDTKRGTSFLERIGAIPTFRNHEPRVSPRAFKVHDIELSPPLPLPLLQQHLDGDPSPPDRYATQEWPHPESD